MTIEDKKKIVDIFLDNGFLLNPDLLNQDISFFKNNINIIDMEDKPLVLDQNLLLSLGKIKQNINWREFERAKVLVEKGKDSTIYKTFYNILEYGLEEGKKQGVEKIVENIEEDSLGVSEILEEEKETENNIILLKMYKDDYKKREIQDFVIYYNKRFEALKKILLGRPELQNVTSINRILTKTNREEVSVIGMVSDKNETKNGNILISLEDTTGIIKVLISKNRSELFTSGKNIVFDEMIGITGVSGGQIIFANNIIFPEVPINNHLKKSPDEVYAAFISDIHVGSKKFLEDEFIKFINWLNGNFGDDDQKNIAKKVKYLFMVGDLVDGVSVYPGQENELLIKDLVKQYEKFAELIGMIRGDIKMIICGGQHDAIRMSEPQPPLMRKYTEAVYKIPNAILVSNPCLVNIQSTKDFEGFNIYMYHGASFHYYVDNVESLRNAKENPSNTMKFLLQKRHFAPTHSSNVFVPETEEDPLVIEKVPDVVVCGDSHRSAIGNHNGVIIINCSCWQSKTDFQEKVGHDPDPAKVPILNLKTREIKILKFGDE